VQGMDPSAQARPVNTRSSLTPAMAPPVNPGQAHPFASQTQRQQSPTRPVQPSQPELVPLHGMDPSHSPRCLTSHQLSAGQATFTHQMQQLYVAQQAVQSQIQQLISQLQVTQPQALKWHHRPRRCYNTTREWRTSASPQTIPSGPQ